MKVVEVIVVEYPIKVKIRNLLTIGKSCEASHHSRWHKILYGASCSNHVLNARPLDVALCAQSNLPLFPLNIGCIDNGDFQLDFKRPNMSVGSSM